ncbi:MAG: hypothetical protein ACOH2I_11530 [Pseudomonas sp.]
MTTQADYTRLLLIEKYGTASARSNASSILKSLYATPAGATATATAAATQGAATQGVAPIPHGSTYDDKLSLVMDVTERLQAFGITVKAQANIIKTVIEQFEGGTV